MSHNYYQLLHVLPDAPAPVIKASYRAMMQKMRHHPDLGGDPARAQLLNEAIDTLCNPARRTIYDRELHAIESRLKRKVATPKATNGEPPQRDRNSNSRTGDHSDIPGGRPHGYENCTEKPDNPSHSETASTAKTIQLPKQPHCLFCKASFSTTPKARQYYPSDDQCHQCKSPAAPIEQLNTSTTEELRRIYRHDHHAAVKLWTHWPSNTHVDARLHDLSLAGCAIESETALVGNAMVLLDTDALKAICQVRYCKLVNGSDKYSIGLAFMTLRINARPGTMFSAIA